MNLRKVSGAVYQDIWTSDIKNHDKPRIYKQNPSKPRSKAGRCNLSQAIDNDLKKKVSDSRRSAKQSEIADDIVLIANNKNKMIKMITYRSPPASKKFCYTAKSIKVRVNFNTVSCNLRLGETLKRVYMN